MGNGLRTFELHALADDPAGAALIAALPAAAADEDPAVVAQRDLASIVAAQGIAPVGAEPATFEVLASETSAITNTRFVKLRQRYGDAAVYGSLATVELDAGNAFLSLRFAVGEPAAIDLAPSVREADALAVVRDRAGWAGGASLESPGQLSLYFDEPGDRFRLAWVFEDVPAFDPSPSSIPAAISVETPPTNEGGGDPEGADPDDPSPLNDYVIDAHTGESIAELPRSMALDDQGADDLGALRRFASDGDNTRRTLFDRALNVRTCDFGLRNAFRERDQLPGDPIANPPDWPRAGVSAHANGSAVATFLAEALRRNGWNGQGGELVSSVNCTYSATATPANTREWKNARWTGAQMIYGQQLNNGSLVTYAVALEIVAHEIFHGVTQSTARLNYQGAPGALNESYSDVFGILIANWRNADIASWSWRIGDGFGPNGGPLRDLSDPARCNQPDSMINYRSFNPPFGWWNDNGGIHRNSGIHNKAFCNLMASQKQGAYLFDARSAAALFYLALSQHLAATSTFSDSRAAVLLVARTLFRDDPARADKLAAIAAAFDAVGIA